MQQAVPLYESTTIITQPLSLALNGTLLSSSREIILKEFKRIINELQSSVKILTATLSKDYYKLNQNDYDPIDSNKLDNMAKIATDFIVDSLKNIDEPLKNQSLFENRFGFNERDLSAAEFNDKNQHLLNNNNKTVNITSLNNNQSRFLFKKSNLFSNCYNKNGTGYIKMATRGFKTQARKTETESGMFFKSRIEHL
jgi:LPS O-antigen subunit length determinant protein (WzzB/FepE family)